MEKFKFIIFLLILFIIFSFSFSCTTQKADIDKTEETEKTAIQAKEIDLGINTNSKVELYQQLNQNEIPVAWHIFLDGVKKASFEPEEGRYFQANLEFDDLDNDGLKEILLYFYGGGSAAEQYLVIYKLVGNDLQQFFALPSDHYEDRERFNIEYAGNYKASFYDNKYDISATIDLVKENYQGSEELLKNIGTWVDPVSRIDIVDKDDDDKKEIFTYQIVVGVSHADIIAFIETEYKINQDKYNIDSIRILDTNNNVIEEKKILSLVD